MAEPTDEELNRHMDVYEERKKEEEEVSMWDRLPLEIQDYIMSLMNFAKKELCEEIIVFLELLGLATR